MGKDLTKFCVPVYFNEPLSMLQKGAEAFKNEYLLQLAAWETCKIKMMAYVAAFSIAVYAGTEGRISKPFNPILGETFEYIGKDFKYIAE